jgi:hypothetical protein
MPASQSAPELVINLLAVAAPAGRTATAGGNLPFAARWRKRLHVDLICARLIRLVGDPFTIGRELGLGLVERCL